MELTMRQALELAEQYGHVPLRISGPPIDEQEMNPLDNVRGVWGVPDGRGGVVPLDQLGSTASPQEAWSRGPATNSPPPGSTSDQVRGVAPSPSMPPSLPSAGPVGGYPPTQQQHSTYTPGSPPPVVININGNQPYVDQPQSMGVGQSSGQSQSRAYSPSSSSGYPATQQQQPSFALGGPQQGPPNFSQQLQSSWNNETPGFAGNAMWQGAREAGLNRPPMSGNQQAYPSYSTEQYEQDKFAADWDRQMRSDPQVIARQPMQGPLQYPPQIAPGPNMDTFLPQMRVGPPRIPIVNGPRLSR